MRVVLRRAPEFHRARARYHFMQVSLHAQACAQSSCSCAPYSAVKVRGGVARLRRTCRAFPLSRDRRRLRRLCRGR